MEIFSYEEFIKFHENLMHMTIVCTKLYFAHSSARPSRVPGDQDNNYSVQVCLKM